MIRRNESNIREVPKVAIIRFGLFLAIAGGEHLQP